MITLKQLAALRSLATATRLGANQANIELSKVLWRTQNEKVKGEKNPPWVIWGYGSWESYVEKELHLSPRKAWSHVRVWQTFFVDLKGKWSWPGGKPLPFEKLVLIEPMVTKTTINEQLKRAVDMSYDELKESWRESYQKGKVDALLVRVVVTVTPDQRSTINYALDVVRKQNEFEGRGDALYTIALNVLGQKKTRRK